MKPLAGLLLLLFVVFTGWSCATIRPPAVEEEEVEQEEEDGIREWFELHDLDLYRPWRSMDKSVDRFDKQAQRTVALHPSAPEHR